MKVFLMRIIKVIFLVKFKRYMAGTSIFGIIIDNFCNVVATWPCHMISLVITLNDISLSPPIALTYHFDPDSLPFQCTKPHSSICWESTLFHHIAETLPTVIPTVILLSSHLLGMQPSLIGSRSGSRSLFKALQLRANDWVIL